MGSIACARVVDPRVGGGGPAKEVFSMANRESDVSSKSEKYDQFVWKIPFGIYYYPSDWLKTHRALWPRKSEKVACSDRDLSATKLNLEKQKTSN